MADLRRWRQHDFVTEPNLTSAKPSARLCKGAWHGLRGGLVASSTGYWPTAYKATHRSWDAREGAG